MGRNTYESLPKGALPNRRNVVLSRSAFNGEQPKAKSQLPSFPGCDVYPTLEAALQSCKSDEDVYIIGGASVYRQAMTVADNLCLTLIDHTPSQADAYFPQIDASQWKQVSSEHHPADDRHAYPYTFADYTRVR